MKQLLITSFIALLTVLPFQIQAAPGGKLDEMDVNLHDKASLQRGAQIFVNYCMSCHGADLMRYSRLAEDLNISDGVMMENLMFTTDKIGETMSIAMQPEDAKKWFGVAPPDLSVIARSRGTDWLYTYLRTFYLDESQTMGTNNVAYPNAAMPHVLWEKQGYFEKNDQGEMQRVTEGELSTAEYDRMTRDLVNFLAYISEPSKLDRLALGKWVLLYLIIFFFIALALKKAYWKDVH